MNVRGSIVLVGREARLLLGMTRLLRLEGWDTVTTGDHGHALAQARRLQPAAVLLDAALPTAAATLRALRASAASAALPVLALGADADAVAALVAEGAREGLVLPLADDHDLLAALARLLAAAPPPEAPAALLGAAPRLESLRATGLLDTAPGARLEDLARLAAQLLSVPTALFSLVDTRRQFFASQVGLAEPWASRRETPLTHSFCQWVVTGNEEVAVSDAREHRLLARNLALRDLGVVAYSGVPVRCAKGRPLGALCAIDGRPRQWVEADLVTLHDLARLVEYCAAPRPARLSAGALQAALALLRRHDERLGPSGRRFLCELSAEIALAWPGQGPR